MSLLVSIVLNKVNNFRCFFVGPSLTFTILLCKRASYFSWTHLLYSLQNKFLKILKNLPIYCNEINEGITSYVCILFHFLLTNL